MASEKYLGEFEQALMLAVLRVGDGAYGSSIRKELEACTGRKVTHGAAYVTLMKVKKVIIQPEERLHLDAGGTSVSYTGKMDYSDPDLIDAFISSLPK